ncbi:hypothetical protein [Belliella aquatica]|uniref:Uncharacterized protein n=1 Tax=Belliella aquatica TaxID=1323734 RepID=A0ABQ1MIW0_9BACT|nr:hypothetical protein [Belliella aquatica]MCH7405458.1 hypothetical protein [Belliella aquatica]GGC41456.1 hypothetical protein GCM10010993_20080 [Belliella aquatica]
MKKLILIAFFALTALFGVGEVYGQQSPSDCEECKPTGNNRQNFVILEAYLSDAGGTRLDVNNCISGSSFFITLNYTSKQDLDNLRILADLVIIENLDSTETREIQINHFVTLAPSANGNNPNQVTIEISLPSGFDCKKERLELVDTRGFWSANDKPISDICDYPPGLCNNSNSPVINVGVDGFVYDFDFVIECLTTNEETVDVTFFISSLAGGTRPLNINWNIQVGGTEYTEHPDGEFSFTIRGLNGGEVISPSLTINDRFSDTELSDDDINVPFIFTATPLSKDNDTSQEIQPNGFASINIDNPENYTFIWRDDFGNFFDPTDPTYLGTLDDGLYRLTVIDNTTGLCREYEFPISSRILPVELLNPNARYENTNKSSLISWATAKENANSHFEIERSDKGINDFKKVGEIDGMGWKDTVTEYEFTDDKLPLSGGNILYRIKQVDFDGNFTYSKVLSVRAEGTQATQGVWRAFPNPTLGDQLKISLLDRSQYDEEQITFRIVHPSLITQGITVNSEDEMNDQLAQLIPRAPKGVLVVEIQWGQKVEHIKVLKK